MRDDAGIHIDVVRSPDKAEQVEELVWEFFGYLRRDFPDRSDMIERYLQVQDVAGELRDLLSRFTPPLGECLLATNQKEPVGTLMLKRRDSAVCEMNRMWVRPDGRKRGVGKKLVEMLIERAREMGFKEMKLEALDERIPALNLYLKMGFETDPDRSDYAQKDLRIIALKRPI